MSESLSGSVKVIFGTFSIKDFSGEERQKTLEILDRYSVRDLDTARNYGDSETVLGELGVGDKYTIHTKARGFAPGILKKDVVLQSAKVSLEELRVKSVDTFFLHSPDPETPIMDTMEAIQQLYEAGVFKHFGVSNFSPEQLQELHDYASSKNYITPSVYQGNYNAVARHIEATLFPLLRQLGMSFYAYSPIAGGFLARPAAEITAASTGRFDKSTFIGQMYQKLYNRPTLIAALEEWGRIAEDAGISRAALANRWVAYHSALKREQGDAVIVGASRSAQLESTLEAIAQGPLERGIAERVEGIWQTVKDEAPLDNYSH